MEIIGYIVSYVVVFYIGMYFGFGMTLRKYRKNPQAFIAKFESLK